MDATAVGVDTGAMLEFLVVLAGLGFVCLVTGIFVVLARWAARKVLDEDDGSSLP